MGCPNIIPDTGRVVDAHAAAVSHERQGAREALRGAGAGQGLAGVLPAAARIDQEASRR